MFLKSSTTATTVISFSLLLVFAVVIFFWMAFHQNGLTMTFFARDYTAHEVTGLDRLGSVSYTHLDVYKRQVYLLVVTILIIICLCSPVGSYIGSDYSVSALTNLCLTIDVYKRQR